MQTDCRKIKQKINWPWVTKMRVFAVPSWSALMFSLIYWACIAEPAAWAQTRGSHDEKQRERERRRQRRSEMDRGRGEGSSGRARVRGATATGRRREKRRGRKAGRRTEKFSSFIFFEAILWPGLNIWGVTSARGPINNGWPSSLQQMGPTASAPAPPLQEALGGAAAQSKQPLREKWSSRK